PPSVYRRRPDDSTSGSTGGGGGGGGSVFRSASGTHSSARLALSNSTAYTASTAALRSASCGSTRMRCTVALPFWRSDTQISAVGCPAPDFGPGKIANAATG